MRKSFIGPGLERSRAGYSPGRALRIERNAYVTSFDDPRRVRKGGIEIVKSRVT